MQTTLSRMRPNYKLVYEPVFETKTQRSFLFVRLGPCLARSQYMMAIVFQLLVGKK